MSSSDSFNSGFHGINYPLNSDRKNINDNNSERRSEVNGDKDNMENNDGNSMHFGDANFD